MKWRALSAMAAMLALVINMPTAARRRARCFCRPPRCLRVRALWWDTLSGDEVSPKRTRPR